LFKWVVRNNGTPFGDDDWKRVKKIGIYSIFASQLPYSLWLPGDGNPGEQKIGAFGVGSKHLFLLFNLN